MTRKELEQLRGLKKELRTLTAELFKPKPTLQPIFYKDYKSGKGRPKTDIGYDNGEDYLASVEKTLDKKYKEQAELIARLESWIEDIEDRETRAIIRLYYRDGWSDEAIADALDYANRETICRKRKNFWNAQAIKK